MNIFGKYYYLITALPPLKYGVLEFPVTFPKFWSLILQEDERLQELAGAVLLRKDLQNLEKLKNEQEIQNEGCFSFEILESLLQRPALASQYLPEPIATYWHTNTSHPTTETNLWNVYFTYLLEIAKKYHSGLEDYLIWEYRLQVALYEYRKKTPYKLQSMPEFIDLFSERRLLDNYKKIENPLQAEVALDRMRWEKISEIAAPYSFHRDEVIVYALHLLILDRWWNISHYEKNIFAQVANG